MGNSECVSKEGGGFEDLCSSRAFPDFVAPNSEHKTYEFDFKRCSNFKLRRNSADGLSPVHPLSGFEIEPPRFETLELAAVVEPKRLGRVAPRWHTVKEYSHAVQTRLYVSGRSFVKCEVTLPLDPHLTTQGCERSVCAFAVCTRGRPIYGSTRPTKSFTHTTQVGTSGVAFALFLEISTSGIFLCPKVLVVLDQGGEVVLVDDRLGPLSPPLSFYVDFALVDDGGRNVQLDIIFRGRACADAACNSAEGDMMKTMRTCLQDYTTFNNHIEPASVSVGYSDIAAHLNSSTVYLQNLVISEEQFEGPAPLLRPYNVWKEIVQKPELDLRSKILFEGEDANAASSAIEASEPPVVHPQLRLPGRPGNLLREEGSDGGGQDGFWYHLSYGRDPADVGERGGGGGGPPAAIVGEFWLSRNSVSKRNTYFHCSSTLAQALTLCIAVRFSCPTTYLDLIADNAATVLRHAPIPTNGVVMGIEQDPRHRDPYDGVLLRMFMEHRNEILDDMVVCECRMADLSKTIVHQEIYDGGSTIFYRLTLLHRDGSLQSAVLQTNVEQLEDLSYIDIGRGGGQYLLVEEPSLRFPISPCLARHELSPENRIFVYSSMAYSPPEKRSSKEQSHDHRPGDEVAEEEKKEEEEEEEAAPHSLAQWGSPQVSDVVLEDWQSAGGGFSDAEHDATATAATPSEPIAGTKRGGRRSGGSCRVAHEDGLWARPLIDSAVLLCRVDEPPFQCIPRSLS